ncbi:MAG: family 20 glycosylhydrolase, partial [Balneolales bacterium]
VPEFDIPGHATSWLVGHPELASIPDSYEIIRSFGIKEPTLDPTSETVYDFLDTFLGEMAGLFPDDYLHIGGDEVTGTDWDESSDIQAYMAENNIPDNEALQAYFNRRVMDILQDNGKTMVGWEEILHPDLPKSIVIQSWYGRQSMIDAAREGYQSLLSNGYYIDLSQPTDLHYVNNPLPPGSPLTEEEKQFIMGGEATMWSEFVTPENIDSRIWPRMAAIAEVFWSTDVPTIDLPSGRELFIPDDLLTPEITQAIDDMYRRLEVVSFRLEELGLTHEKNYDMMIRRLANNKDTQPVKTLVDVIEPVKIYNRGSQREYTSYSPMTRAVDAARPDARVAREFRKLVADFIYSGGSDATIGQEIQQRLTLWEGNHEVFVESVSYSPVLEEIETLSKDLALISTTGMEALSFIQASEKASEQWAKNALELTSASMEPRGQVELRVISAVEKMIKFAAE